MWTTPSLTSVSTILEGILETDTGGRVLAVWRPGGIPPSSLWVRTPGLGTEPQALLSCQQVTLTRQCGQYFIFAFTTCAPLFIIHPHSNHNSESRPSSPTMWSATPLKLHRWLLSETSKLWTSAARGETSRGRWPSWAAWYKVKLIINQLIIMI